MKIKVIKTCFALVGAATLFAAPNLFASYTVIGTGSLLITAPGYSATGDEAGPYDVSHLVVATGVNPGSSFQTFCVGSQVDYYPGTTYQYQISTTVQPFGNNSGGFVTWGAAYLYSQFINGSLGGGTGNNAINDGLQEAIWALQGQAEIMGTDSYEAVFLADALAAAGSSAQETSDADGAFGVYALNLVGSNGAYAQPQLCIVPGSAVPEPSTIFAGALLLLPLSVGVVRSLRKERAA